MADLFTKHLASEAMSKPLTFQGAEYRKRRPNAAPLLKDDEEIDITTSYVNVIWLDDLMEAMIASHKVAAVPAKVLNMTGTEKVSVVDIATRLGELMGKEPKFKNEPQGTNLLGKADEMARLLGEPKVSLDEGLRRVAESIMAREHPIDHPTQWEKRKAFGED